MKVFISTQESSCDECGKTLGKCAWITLAVERGAPCLSCADLGHLIFLVATEIGVRHGLMPAFAWWLVKFAALSPEQGAATSIYLASSPDVADAHGLYFHKCKPIKPSPAALDGDAALRLWEISSRLTGIDWVDGFFGKSKA